MTALFNKKQFALKVILIITTLFLTVSLFGQESGCHFIVTGKVIDSNTLKPLELTNIEVMGEKGKGTSSSSNGVFILNNLCKGMVELHVSHLQCEHIHLFFILNKDTSIVIYLHHSDHIIDKVTITTKNENQDNLETVNIKQIQLLKGSSVSEMMQAIGGITILKTGGTISKPMVDGLHSNRVIILNNGIRQEGQNWGLEHAPEIDAFLATEIELLKGAEALRYAADGVGGVIMVKPPSIFNEKSNTLKGELNLVGNTNGRGGATSLILGNMISEKIPLYWRVQGTVKRSGNIRTPSYFMANTGFKEINYSAALGYQGKRLKVELFYSSFYNNIGIFKGSHIGNIADLEKAFKSDTPTVQSGFSYAIDRPYQQVWHQLTKANAEWLLNSKSKLQFVAAYQKNHREEYDILRSSTSYKGPNFDYYINTLLSDITFIKTNLHSFNYTTGINATYQSNSFTGRFFIPGFYNKGIGAYFITDRRIAKWKLEAAIRLDYKHLTAYLWKGISLSVNQLYFGNATYAIQAAYQQNKYLKITAGLSSAWRPPAPNELFSNGLHQGLATIEIGDSLLKPERSFNQFLNLRYAHHTWLFESELYDKYINGFINLVPALPAQLTIRGAFPVYRYVQQNVNMVGLNLMVKHEFQHDIFMKLSSNLLIANNLDKHIPLAQMPPLSAKLWIGRDNKKYMVQFWYQATARQFRYTDGSDYAAPPKGFALFGMDASRDFKIKKQAFKFNISINNILNTKYRDYLNRFRYYTNEPGFGLTARLIMPLQLNTKKHQ